MYLNHLFSSLPWRTPTRGQRSPWSPPSRNPVQHDKVETQGGRLDASWGVVSGVSDRAELWDSLWHTGEVIFLGWLLEGSVLPQRSWRWWQERKIWVSSLRLLLRLRRPKNRWMDVNGWMVIVQLVQISFRVIFWELKWNKGKKIAKIIHFLSVSFSCGWQMMRI